MRIWCQSSTTLGKKPTGRDYEETLKKHVQEVARADTIVDVHGVELMSPAIANSFYARSLNTSQMIDNAIRAEKEGYDVFASVCMGDPGFFELKEVINIPIVFAFQISCHISTLFAYKFALLPFNDLSLLGAMERVRQYGLGEKVISAGSIGIPMDELTKGFRDPAPLLKGAREVAKRAAKQGAGMLIPTCGELNMVMVANGIKDIEGIPVIDSAGTVIKVAELFKDLENIGVKRSSQGLFTSLTKEELAAVRKLYKVER